MLAGNALQLAEGFDRPAFIKIDTNVTRGGGGMPRIDVLDLYPDTSQVSLLESQLDVNNWYRIYARVNHTAKWDNMGTVDIYAWYDEGDDATFWNYNIHNTSNPGRNINMNLTFTKKFNSTFGEVVGTGDGGTNIFTSTLNNAPLVPGEHQLVFQAYDSALQLMNITDAGDGTVYQEGIGPAGIINYTTGDFQIIFNSPPPNLEPVKAKYLWNPAVQVNNEPIGSADGVTQEYQGYLLNNPVVPGSATFYGSKGGYTLVDTGLGTLTGDGTGWINYATGQYLISITIPPALGDDVYADYVYQIKAFTVENYTIDSSVNLGTDYNGIIPDGDLIPASISFNCSGQVLIDLGNGNFYEIGGGIDCGDINYTTGEYFISFSAATAGNQPINVTYSAEPREFQMNWPPPSSGEVTFDQIKSLDYIVDNYTHDLYFRFKPNNQIRWSNGTVTSPWTSFNGGQPGIDNPTSWNVNVTCMDSWGDPGWVVSGRQFEEFGVYRFTSISSADNPEGTGAPDGPMVEMSPHVSLWTASNCLYNVSANISDLSGGAGTMPLSSIWVCGGQQASPVQFTDRGDGVSNDIFFWGGSGSLYNPATDGVISNGTSGGEPITVIWYVEVPPGTAEGVYTTSITYKIQHDIL